MKKIKGSYLRHQLDDILEKIEMIRRQSENIPKNFEDENPKNIEFYILLKLQESRNVGELIGYANILMSQYPINSRRYKEINETKIALETSLIIAEKGLCQIITNLIGNY